MTISKLLKAISYLNLSYLLGDSTNCYSSCCTVKLEAELLKNVTKVYIQVVKEGKLKDAHKIDVAENFKFGDRKDASSKINDLIRSLMMKAKELSEQTLQSISPASAPETSTNGVKESEKKEDKPEDEVKAGGEGSRPAFDRCYSMDSTSGMFLNDLKKLECHYFGNKTLTQHIN